MEESGSSSDSDGEAGGEISATSFLKKKPESEASKMLKGAKDSGDESSSSDEDEDEDWGEDSEQSGRESSDEEDKKTYLAEAFLKPAHGTEKGEIKKGSKKRDKIKPRKRIEGEGEEEGGEEVEGGWEKVKYGVPLVKVNICKDNNIQKK
ncbi:hypothetical protein OJAV_G00235490 [Oryzias javanicus]|uniref:Uncharacterized protein n=1 Tax=Oryzias javanicus TaxID=123683 RepID=A0A437BZQ4_ORYJA|nr:hypothetical protein OJAV_G00235490 [Oryzias javanicus]